MVQSKECCRREERLWWQVYLRRRVPVVICKAKELQQLAVRAGDDNVMLSSCDYRSKISSCLKKPRRSSMRSTCVHLQWLLSQLRRGSSCARTPRSSRIEQMYMRGAREILAEFFDRRIESSLSRKRIETLRSLLLPRLQPGRWRWCSREG